MNTDNTVNKKSYGFCNIIVEGILTNGSTGIATAVSFGTPVATEFYNAAGQRVDASAKGLVIMRQRMTDGTTRSVKVVR